VQTTEQSYKPEPIRDYSGRSQMRNHLSTRAIPHPTPPPRLGEMPKVLYLLACPYYPNPLLSKILNHVEYARSVSYEATIDIIIIPVCVQYSGISTSADDRLNIWSVGAGGAGEGARSHPSLYPNRWISLLGFNGKGIKPYGQDI